MAITNSKRLFDICVRLQIFIEGVKNSESLKFNRVSLQVKEEFSTLLKRVRYDTLDGLTKAELNALVASLRASQLKIYSIYTRKLLKQLEEFMQANLVVNKRVHSYFYFDYPENENLPSEEDSNSLIEQEQKKKDFFAVFGLAALIGSPKKLWSRILNDPIAANGAMPKALLTSFSASAQMSVESLIRKGYSNGWTVRETLAELDSQLAKVANQADAVVSTIMQHVSAHAAQAVQSALYKQYVWISIIDSGTTDICRSRNKKVYIFGKGPVPPAHIRCRSIIMPWTGESADATFYTWVKSQNAEMQNFALGKKSATALRNGELTAKDGLKLDASPITIDEFIKSANKIAKGL
ncbi:head morphogenesis protein [Xanthomonas phage XAJ2]|uniref:Head morphogenesis protein n=1 Tax=Xanthomonas phage XAJ2 TaxID=1775249 RepID=A0A1I9L2D7_9CAUD|nr:head morphogenesis protein [Xanthomonas phage XAJ2]